LSEVETRWLSEVETTLAFDFAAFDFAQAAGWWLSEVETRWLSEVVTRWLSEVETTLQELLRYQFRYG
jgi:hypothetical protein